VGEVQHEAARVHLAAWGAAAAWPLATRAQQSAMPVVGFFSPLAPGSGGHLHEVFRRVISSSPDELGHVF